MGNLDIFEMVFERSTARCSSFGANGNTLLHYAAQSGHAEIMEALLEEPGETLSFARVLLFSRVALGLT